MPNYKLINPTIEGNFINTFDKDNELDAAEETWRTLSKYITNNVPKFAFTLEKISDGQLSHFLVKESLSGNGYANYKVSKIKLNMKESDQKLFKDRINNLKKPTNNIYGGKKHKHKHRHKKHNDNNNVNGNDNDDSSSSSSSSSSSAFTALKLFKSATATIPITYWWYDPLIYGFNSIYIPTFVSPLTPYIEVTTLNYYP